MITQALYGAQDDRCFIVRIWLYGAFPVLPIGRVLMRFYQRHGRTVAAWLRASRVLRFAVRLLLDAALRRGFIAMGPYVRANADGWACFWIHNQPRAIWRKRLIIPIYDPRRKTNRVRRALQKICAPVRNHALSEFLHDFARWRGSRAVWLAQRAGDWEMAANL